VRAPPEAPPRHDDTLNVMRNLASKKINAFSGIGHGFYFWNFRTDLYEPYWNYMLAIELGYIPKGNLNDDSVVKACDKEDSSEIRCIANRRAPEKNVHAALAYIFSVENVDDADANLTGDELYETADTVIDSFWQTHRHEDATCDFGGVGVLVASDINPDEKTDDEIYGNDDEYFGGGAHLDPMEIILLADGVGLGTFLLTLVCFISAMRTNKKFNRLVREAPVFIPIARTQSAMIRKSLMLDHHEYQEILRDVKEYTNSSSAPSF
jgi:hypothetical protein